VAKKLIKEGRTTWEDLEKRGKALPLKTHAAKNATVQWFLEQ
jgi:hypothetical protein